MCQRMRLFGKRLRIRILHLAVSIVESCDSIFPWEICFYNVEFSCYPLLWFQMPYPYDPAADGRQETALWPLFWQTSSAHGIKPIVGAKSKCSCGWLFFFIISVNTRNNYRPLQGHKLIQLQLYDMLFYQSSRMVCVCPFTVRFKLRSSITVNTQKLTHSLT